MSALSSQLVDPVHVRVAERAIKIIMWQNALDADAAAHMIRARAAFMDFTILEVTEAIVAFDRT